MELLDQNIKTSQSVLDVLNEESVALANKVVKTLSTDDPGLVVQITDEQSLHAALGLPFSPVDPGHNVEASVAAFKNWLILSANAALGPSASHQQVGAGLLAWHHLSEEQAHTVIMSWSVAHWQVAIRDRGLPEFAICLWMSGTGVAKAHMFVRRSVFN